MTRTRAHGWMGVVTRDGGRLHGRWSGSVRAPRRDDRGDVPGWVLITLMTAGIVTLLWATAGPLLASLFTHAIQSVKAP